MCQIAADEAMPNAGQRILIVNADDFGRSHGVNRGIRRAHEHGIVTSASLMVRWPEARDAADYAREHPDLSLGLHLDLCEWVFEDDEWRLVYEVAPTEDTELIARALDDQLARFRTMVGGEPTHIDSHQHVHRNEPVRSVVIQKADALGVPLRDFSPLVMYRGDFYGQSATGHGVPEAITVGALTRLIAELPAGVTELGCHPGEDGDAWSSYGEERAVEVATLCDPVVPDVLRQEQVQLRSFHHLSTWHRTDDASVQFRQSAKWTAH